MNFHQAAADVQSPFGRPSELSLAPDAEKTRRAWESLLKTGELRTQLLRPHVQRAWSRCAKAGTDATSMRASKLSADELSALLSREATLLEVARPYLQALSRAAGDEDHAAMLSDRHAVLLDVLGNEPHIHAPGFPEPGSVLTEENAGANGIGTCLAEQRYVEIVGPEHFIEGFQIYTCQGIPLIGPDAEVIGALSMSVRRLETADRVQEILFCAAHGIEVDLIRKQLSPALAALRVSEDGRAPSLDHLQQDVVQLAAATRLKVELAAELVGQSGPTRAARLTQAAADLAMRFRTQSSRWLEIASNDVGAPQALDVGERAREIRSLLSTEARVRGIEVSVRAEERVHLTLDSRELSRVLFRAFMKALSMDAGNARPELVVHVVKRADAAVVRFSRGQSEFAIDLRNAHAPGTCV